MERLAIPVTELKLAGPETMVFSGYGAVFNNVDAYGDVIKPGAFAETLSESQKTGQWPSMLLQHGGFGLGSEDLMPIGVWTSLAEDGHGLKVEGQLADTQRGKEAYTLLKMSPRPAINGLSIGYIPKKFENRTKPEEPRRTLTAVDLMEVSLVTFPANPKARIQNVKSILDMQSLSDVEGFLRDAGMSIREAKRLVAHVRDLSQRDVDESLEIAAALTRNMTTLR